MLLAEQFIILGLDDKSGKLPSTAAHGFHYGISGALLLDLHAQNRISFERKIMSHEVIVEDPAPIGDPLLDEIFGLIKESERLRNLQRWIWIISLKYPQIREALFSRLVHQGILRRSDGVRLEIFKDTHHPLEKPEVKEAILVKIKKTLLNEAEPDPEALALLGLIRGCAMIRSIFAQDYRREGKRRIDELMDSESDVDAVLKALVLIRTQSSNGL